MRVKRTPGQAERAKATVKALLKEMRQAQSMIARASKYVRQLDKLPLNDVEFRRARSRVLNRWNDFRETLIVPLNQLQVRREDEESEKKKR
jgi:hypothetical protein